MKSYTGTSKLELSPGAINPDDLYQSPNPYHNPYKEHEEQLSAVQEENLRLKTSLARVQNEYEELRDESNYQRAKVSELTELVKSSSSQSPVFVQPQTVVAPPNEFADSAIHKSLIEKSLQNAELTLNYDKLKIELNQANAKMKDLQLQKRANGKLLLEMSDVIRTLNAVDIEYDAYTPKGQKVSAQEQSVKNIKLKVDAMLKNRNALMLKCRELHDLSKAQKRKIVLLEAQVHDVNSVNLGDEYSVSGSTLSDDRSEQSSIVSKQSSKGATDAAASEIVRQSEEIVRYKKQEQEYEKTIARLQSTEERQKEIIARLEDENMELSAKLASVKKTLKSTKIVLEDAEKKRDAFKADLVAVIGHYRELKGDNDSSNDKIANLEQVVTMLQSKVRESAEKEVELERSYRSASTRGSTEDGEDMSVAYSKAKEQIKELKDALMKQELEASEYRDSISRLEQMKRERNAFQKKLDHALEDNQLMKQKLEKEKDESKQARRQLKTLLQHRDDDTASLDSANTGRKSHASSPSTSQHSRSNDSQTSRSRSSTHKKALVKKAAFKPLTVEELMEKDFS